MDLTIASSLGLRLILRTYSNELDYDAIIELLETATKQMKIERDFYLKNNQYLAGGHRNLEVKI